MKSVKMKIRCYTNRLMLYFIRQFILFKFPDFEMMVTFICLKQVVYGIVEKKKPVYFVIHISVELKF